MCSKETRGARESRGGLEGTKENPGEEIIDKGLIEKDRKASYMDERLRMKPPLRRGDGRTVYVK